MKIYANQLSAQLKNLSPVYLVSGDEFLLVQETCDAIRHQAKQQGFIEREIISVSTSTSWSDFFSSANNLSLFSTQKIIELRFTQKPNKAAQEAISHYLREPNLDNVLLINTPKLEAASQKTKWYKAIDNAGVCVAIWPIDQQRLPQWIKQRGLKHHLNLSAEVIAAITAQTEGNLLATNQEIEKLALVFTNSDASSEEIIETLTSNYHYSIFNLIDCCLQRNTAQISKIVASLKNEGVEANLALWAITREIRTLITLGNSAKMQGLDRAFSQLRIWDKRKPLYRNFLSRSKKSRLFSCLQKASSIDRCIKGAETGNTWQQLLELALRLAY